MMMGLVILTFLNVIFLLFIELTQPKM
jgi:hypothetical protein